MNEEIKVYRFQCKACYDKDAYKRHLPKDRSCELVFRNDHDLDHCPTACVFGCSQAEWEPVTENTSEIERDTPRGKPRGVSPHATFISSDKDEI